MATTAVRPAQAVRRQPACGSARGRAGVRSENGAGRVSQPHGRRRERQRPAAEQAHVRVEAVIVGELVDREAEERLHQDHAAEPGQRAPLRPAAAATAIRRGAGFRASPPAGCSARTQGKKNGPRRSREPFFCTCSGAISVRDYALRRRSHAPRPASSAPRKPRPTSGRAGASSSSSMSSSPTMAASSPGVEVSPSRIE